jgi:enamine deaminase RidA (YjgF/YER057c/UK114 family)
MTNPHTTLLPDGWTRPKGYANGISAHITPETEVIFVSGQVGWDENEVFQSDTFAGQFRQTLLNTKAILAKGGAGPEHIVRMTWFISNAEEYLGSLAEVGAVYRDIMGKNYPAMSVIVVAGFIEKGAKLEIETTAVV